VIGNQYGAAEPLGLQIIDYRLLVPPTTHRLLLTAYRLLAY